MLKRLGVQNLAKFDFMSPPPSQTLIRALETLYSLTALDSEGKITRLGSILAEFPLEPQLAKCLITSPLYGCVLEMLSIVAMLSVPSVFSRPTSNRGNRGNRSGIGGRDWKDLETEREEAEDDINGSFGASNSMESESRREFADPESDHITLLNMYSFPQDSEIVSTPINAFHSPKKQIGAHLIVLIHVLSCRQPTFASSSALSSSGCIFPFLRRSFFRSMSEK